MELVIAKNVEWVAAYTQQSISVVEERRAQALKAHTIAPGRDDPAAGRASYSNSAL